MSCVALVLVLLFKVILSDDCPPCKCQLYNGVYRITCCANDNNELFFHPLTSIPTINFTTPVRWEDISLDINILNQPLKHLTANDFEKAGLKRLESITANKCDLRTVDKDAFKNVTNLVYLDLSSNDLTTLDDKLFEHTIYIKFLKLNHNKLTSINDKILKDLTKLESLEISNNLLTTFHENSLRNNKILKKLHLDYNKLTHLNINQLKTNTKFQILKIAGNPWICDCLLNDLFTYITNKFLRDGSNYEKELSGTYCSAPKFDNPWRKLKENFTCWINSKSDNKVVKTKVKNSVKLSCIVESNVQPNVTWTFENKNVEIINKKYNLTIAQLHEATYNYSLQISDLTKSDQGKYRCILENSLANQSTEAEITLNLEKEPLDVILIIIIILLVLFAVCVIALLFKCFIKYSIANNLTEAQPKFEDYSDDNISIQSFKRHNFNA